MNKMKVHVSKAVAATMAAAVLAILPACESTGQNKPETSPAETGTTLIPLTLNGRTVTLAGTGTIRLPADLCISGNALQHESIATLNDSSLTLAETTGTLYYSQGISVSMKRGKRRESVQMAPDFIRKHTGGTPVPGSARKITIRKPAN